MGIISGFQYLMKTCHQWAKDHPMVSGVLSFFYLLYIILPSIFSILFYSFPLVICSAILIGKPNMRHPKKIKKEDHVSKHVQTYVDLPLTDNNDDEDIESDDDEGGKKAVVEWTEDDERNVMDVGSLEIERNKRLEKLMEKRKAKKIVSMQPRRSHYYMNNSIDSVGVRPLMLVRPRASRNPFDLPYDSHEERPILRGGSFEEELFAHVLKDLPISGRHEDFSFIPKPLPPSKLASSLFTDLDENLKKEEVKKEEELDVSLNSKSGYSSSSSVSASSRTSRKSRSSRKSRINARKNETSRNNTLSCLVVVPSNCPTGKGKSSSSTNIEPVSKHLSGPGPGARARAQHRNSCSIASDMQVEVSEEGGSPSLGPLDPSSPTDRESLVYDGDDEERDANSGDEDFWANSPHPRGSMALLPPRPVMAQENNQRGVDQNSTHADIIESRPSVASSSSESLSSQQHQGKAQHLADYLACLDPLEIQSNQIQGPGTSLVREQSAQEISIQEDNNGVLNMRYGEQSHGRGPSEKSKGSSSASNECVAFADQNQHSEDDEIEVREESPTNNNVIHEEECSSTEKATTGEPIHVIDRDQTSKDSKVSLPDSNEMGK